MCQLKIEIKDIRTSHHPWSTFMHMPAYEAAAWTLEVSMRSADTSVKFNTQPILFPVQFLPSSQHSLAFSDPYLDFLQPDFFKPDLRKLAPSETLRNVLMSLIFTC